MSVSGGGAGGGAEVDAAASAAEARPSKRMEIASAALALLGFAVLVVLARGIELRAETGGIDPRWWPQILGTAGAVLSLVLLAQAVLRAPAERDGVQEATRDGRLRTVLAVVLAAAYVLAWPLVGFVVVTPVFLLAATYLFGGRGWKALLLFPTALTAVLYLLFHTVLKVPL
jgi:Tripartite tricarboxylate transporter TctB family